MTELKIFTMEDIETEQVSWLWKPYIPFGKITIVQGDPGDGKTTMMLAIAAALTNGEPLPGDIVGDEPTNVIFQTAEDGLADTVKPKLELLGADCSRIHVIDDSDISLTLNDERIEQAIIKTNAKLLIIDPIQAYLGKSDLNSAKGMRPLMKSLGAAAGRTDCAVVIIGHLNKQSRTKSQYRGLGSIDIYAAARSVLMTCKLEADMRAIIHIKSNLAKNGAMIAFSFDDAVGFTWHGEFEINFDDFPNNEKQENKSQSDRAEQFIQDILADGPVEAKTVEEMAGEAGIALRTLKRAKAKLGVASVKRNGIWYWELPVETTFVDDDEGCQECQSEYMAALALLPSAFNDESG
jgi:archaellum biogenesis ATPase FlaH